MVSRQKGEAGCAPGAVRVGCLVLFYIPFWFGVASMALVALTARSVVIVVAVVVVVAVVAVVAVVTVVVSFSAVSSVTLFVWGFFPALCSLVFVS